MLEIWDVTQITWFCEATIIAHHPNIYYTQVKLNKLVSRGMYYYQRRNQSVLIINNEVEQRKVDLYFSQVNI
jgi:Zn-dependent peptidase ImmA (M78 family)